MVQVIQPDRCADHGAAIGHQVQEACAGLYFFGAAGVNLVKIGYVRKVHRVMHRLHALQPGCPYRLSLLFVLTGIERLDESRLHKLFAEYHHQREWFRIEGGLKLFLQKAIVAPEEAAMDMQEYLLSQRRLT